MKHAIVVPTVQIMTNADLVRWAKAQEPSQGVVHVLCDALEQMLNDTSPPVRTWEGVWKVFEERNGRNISIPSA